MILRKPIITKKPESTPIKIRSSNHSIKNLDTNDSEKPVLIKYEAVPI